MTSGLIAEGGLSTAVPLAMITTLSSAMTRASVRPTSVDRLVRQDAAIHGGAGGLRQRILGVPGLQHGGDAGGAHLRVVVGPAGERRQRLGIGAAGEQRLDRIGDRGRLGHGQTLEIGARHRD